MRYLRRHTKRILIGLVGSIVVLLGLVMIPYPGPGWLVVFAGLTILATEFDVAARALNWLKDKYDRWLNWLKRQHRAVQLLVLAGTGLVVLATVWLLNAFGFLTALLALDIEWLVSPFWR